MKRAEAIRKLQKQKAEYLEEWVDYSGVAEAYDMAIEALSKPNYESDTEVRLAVTDRKKEKVILWDAFGEVEYYPCDKSETRSYDEDDYWNGRIPTIQADRPSKADKDGMDTEQAKKYCKECQHNEVCRYYPYDGCQFKDADRPHGEWIEKNGHTYICDQCGFEQAIYGNLYEYNFCQKCDADMRKETVEDALDAMKVRRPK